jgi:RNA 2',3'-cyclic 3'-phosphodiesterase
LSTRRIFFALWPGEQQQAAIAHASSAVLNAAEGRLVPVQNFHLTLAFLGSVAVDALPRVHKVADDVSNAVRADGTPIELTLDHIDYWRKAEILCAAATTISKPAIELAERLKRELIEAEFTPDLKAFRAHVTLARKVRRAPKMDLHLLPVVLSFRDFSLVESHTKSEGSIYSVVDSWPLCAC